MVGGREMGRVGWGEMETSDSGGRGGGGRGDRDIFTKCTVTARTTKL